MEVLNCTFSVKTINLQKIEIKLTLNVYAISLLTVQLSLHSLRLMFLLF